MSDFATYYASLPDDDLLRLTADIANLLPQAREALKAETERRNLSTAALDWGAQPLAPLGIPPYSWGKFQGWFSLISGVLAFFAMAAKGDILGIALTCLSAIIGYGLIRKRRWGFVLFFIAAAIAAGIALVLDTVAILSAFSGSEQASTLLAQAVMVSAINGLWWVVPAVTYYRKRMSEFRKAAVGV